MKLSFYKYQGAGNDFIIIDNRNLILEKNNKALIEKLCDRRFGVGADGFMLLQNKEDFDFEMIYFNSDGLEGTMCGNGGRCIVAFANYLGLISRKTKFIAVDGEHHAKVINSNYINLKMIDVNTIEQSDNSYFLDTGSPHYVSFVEGVEDLDVYKAGREIRFNDRFKKVGTNVNFVEEINNRLLVRTYERGVENETLACGTGITASAIAYALHSGKDKQEYEIKALGGELKVRFNINKQSFNNIWLEGPAELVFSGEIEI